MIPGQRFGRLTVIDSRVSGTGRKKRTIAICRCDCGGEKHIRQDALASGVTQSCGCLNQERRIARAHDSNPANRTHGQSSTKEYRAWQSMLQRCRNPKSAKYGDYGGRGIKVCERWNNFENFFVDMGRAPSPQHSLDRIDNDGNYEPGNCRWATATEQRANRRAAR